MDQINIIIEEFREALIQVNRIKAGEIFEKCYLDSNSFDVLEHLVTEVLKKVGDEWEDDQLSLSQVYMSGLICEELIAKYLPNFEGAYKSELKIAIAVLQDYHALGKRMVYSVLRAGGYDLIDFGQGLTVEQLVEKTIEEKIEILLISTLMLPSALKVKDVVHLLREKGSPAKIIVGGAPFRLDQTLWKKVGADAYGKNGTEVPKL